MEGGAAASAAASPPTNASLLQILFGGAKRSAAPPEPQPAPATAPGQHATPAAAPTKEPTHGIQTEARADNPPSLRQILFGGGAPVDTASTPQQASALTQGVPDEMRPIVQQQLDAVSSQRLLWHGEAWPGQALDWEIVREDESGNNARFDEDTSWRTTLKLDTPRLGHVAATLRLTSGGIYMTLTTARDAAAANLQDEGPRLATALDAAGIPLLSFLVRHEPE